MCVARGGPGNLSPETVICLSAWLTFRTTQLRQPVARPNGSLGRSGELERRRRSTVRAGVATSVLGRP